MNPLHTIATRGQSLWLDYIHRRSLDSGELTRLIEEDGLKGLTSNPSIFMLAIVGGTDYADALRLLRNVPDGDDQAAYEVLALEDIRRAADQFRPVFEASGGRDGYVSLEVSPRHAYDAEATRLEARRFWRILNRANLMIKVPATPPGIAAMEDLIAEGINVNVTLLFSTDVYVQVAEAYWRGLERWVERGGDPARVSSVASFFISRIDTAVDAYIDEHIKAGATPARAALFKRIRGQVAIANAKVAYQRYKTLCGVPRWKRLAALGARPQRLLWASTGVKNPADRDVRYLEELIGPETVNTVPPATLDAFRDHGVARASLEEGVDQALESLALAEEAGVPLRDLTGVLLKDGAQIFIQAFDRLLAAVAAARVRATCG